MVKRKDEGQIDNLTPEHKKSGINRITLRVGGVQHTIVKFSMRATTLLQTSSQSGVYTQNYSIAKFQEFQPWQFWDSHLGVTRQKII
jgi:hypothetical protein